MTTTAINSTTRYTTGRCTLGHLVLAAGERGISLISLGTNPRELIENLLNNFPNAQPSDQPPITTYIQAVIQYIEHPNRGTPDLPLDIHGTTFQQDVWDELRRIPPGRTRTYAEIAQRIGRPTAARAVGQACAANPIAIVIPCHRATGANNRLTGYRWGLPTKRALIEHEARQPTLFTT